MNVYYVYSTYIWFSQYLQIKPGDKTLHMKLYIREYGLALQTLQHAAKPNWAKFSNTERGLTASIVLKL